MSDILTTADTEIIVDFHTYDPTGTAAGTSPLPGPWPADSTPTIQVFQDGADVLDNWTINLLDPVEDSGMPVANHYFCELTCNSGGGVFQVVAIAAVDGYEGSQTIATVQIAAATPAVSALLGVVQQFAHEEYPFALTGTYAGLPYFTNGGTCLYGCNSGGVLIWSMSTDGPGGYPAYTNGSLCGPWTGTEFSIVPLLSVAALDANGTDPAGTAALAANNVGSLATSSALAVVAAAVTGEPAAIITALITAGVLQYVSGSSGPLQLTTTALANLPPPINISTEDTIEVEPIHHRH